MREVIQRDTYYNETVVWTFKPCKVCEGTGRRWHAGCGDSDTTCANCDGHGETVTRRTIRD